jgi:hypothetical protein
MLADEMTAELRARRDEAVATARATNSVAFRPITSKGISYGEITAHPDGSMDLSKVNGVDTDLRVRPFFAHGGAYSIRDFIVGALHNEVTTPSPEGDGFSGNA